MFGNLSRADRRLQIECQQAAMHSRDMWKGMKAKGYGWTWEHYRGWILDARDIRLGLKFQGKGSRGVKSCK